MNYTRDLRRRANVTQEKLAELAGITRPYLAKAESGRQTLSDKLDAQLVAICEGLIESNTPNFDAVEEREEPRDKTAFGSFPTIPVIGMAAAAHYNPLLNNFCDLLECTEERVPCLFENSDGLIGMRITGNSMYPELRDGDIIAVSDQLPGTGEMCITYHCTDGILCKRWYWRNGIVRLDSINEAEGKNYRWTKEEFQATQPLAWRFKVIGIVQRLF